MIFLVKKMGRVGLIGVSPIISHNDFMLTNRFTLGISAYSRIGRSLTDRYTNHFNIGALMEKGVRFIGNGQAPGTSLLLFPLSIFLDQLNRYPVHLYWEEIMEYLKDGTFDTKFLVTHRVKLEDFPELYKAFDKRYAG